MMMMRSRTTTATIATTAARRRGTTKITSSPSLTASTLFVSLLLLLLLSTAGGVVVVATNPRPATMTTTTTTDEAAVAAAAATISFRRVRPKRSLREEDAAGEGDSLDFSEILDPDYADAMDDENENDDGSSLSSFLALLSRGLIMAKAYLLSTDDDGGTLNLNTVVNGLVDEDGFVLLEIEDGYVLELGPGSTVNLTHVGVKGLDTFQPGTADLLMAPSSSSDDDVDVRILENRFVLETLVLDLYMIEVVDSAAPSEIVVRLPFGGVDVSSMPLLLDVATEGLAGFPLGAALNGTHTLPCLRERSVVRDASFLELEATFDYVGVPELLSSSSGEDASSPFVGAVTTLFIGLPASVPIFFNSTVRGLLNDFLSDNLVLGDDDDDDEIVFEGGAACPAYPTTLEEDDGDDDDDLVDFRTFFLTGLPAFLVGLLEDELLAVDPATGSPRINEELIVPMMEALSEEDDGDGDNREIRDPTTGTTTMVFGSAGSGGLVNVTGNVAIGGLVADVSLRVTDLEVTNLDTMIPPLMVLKPMTLDPRWLYNVAAMGVDLDDLDEEEPPSSEARSMGVSAKVFLSIDADEDDGGVIEHDLLLRVDARSLMLRLTALLEIVEPRLRGFPVRDVLNLECWLATVRTPEMDPRTGVRVGSSFTAGIADLWASVDGVAVGVGCLTEDEGGACSPAIGEWIDLLETPAARASATESANSILEYVASDVLSDGGAILQTPIDRWLHDAPFRCPHDPRYDPEVAERERQTEWEPLDALPEIRYSYGYLAVWGSLSLALVLGCGVAALLVRSTVRRRNERWIAAGKDDDDVDGGDEEERRKRRRRLIDEERRRQREEDELSDAVDASTRSLFGSADETVPAVVRWGVPAIILGNVALFLSGHLNVAATVYIELSVAGETIRVGDFFDFAIARTTVDLWKAGGRSLAALMVVFSIVWPYTKQILTLALWFLPPTRVSVATRGKWLIWLDKLAKWSMIDIFVIVVCVAAFRVTVSSPDDVAFLPPDLYGIELVIVPVWGLYANMTAQLVSQVSSHFVMMYHRRVVASGTTAAAAVRRKNRRIANANTTNTNNNSGAVESAVEEEDDENENERGAAVSLQNHAFSPRRAGDDRRLVAKPWVGPALLAATAAVAVLVAVGCFLPSFSVEILGLLGVAVELGTAGTDAEAVTHHSVWSISAMLFDEARFLGRAESYVGIACLTALFFLTILVVPIVQAAGLVYQWYVPLAPAKRRALSIANEILRAWQYVEVYLIALFVASWQLGPVSQYMFNAYCGSLDEFFARMVSYGILDEVDAQCFSVQGSIDPGLIALLVAAVLLALANSMVTLAGEQCLAEDRAGGNGSRTSGSSGSPEGVESTTATTTTATEKAIRPFPFLFTDGYRWLLAPAAESERGSDSV